MFKILCAAALLAQLIASAKIGQLIGPISGDDESWPLFGTFYTNKYAKIAREIVHNSSEWIEFDQIKQIFRRIPLTSFAI